MPRQLTFKYKKKEFEAVPFKIDRKKLYGWTEIVALDEAGEPCNLVSTDDSGSYIIPKGGTGMGILSPEGEWVERSTLVAVNEDGSPADLISSSFNTVISLNNKIMPDEFLNYSITDFYQLQDVPSELITAIGNDIYLFDYCYVDGCEGFPAFVMTAGEKEKNLYLLIGTRNLFEMIRLEQPSYIDEIDDDTNPDDGDALDFSMF